MTTPQLRDQVQRSLGATYTLLRELGGGGMSRVFLAEEVAFGRMVVIKVLSPEKIQGLLADRFAREIKLAANLQHPHIVPLFSAGSIDGLPYYTMPFVAGESLRTRLKTRKTIGAEEGLQILRDTARALEYAHARGVVHRDIKPDNILLSGNSACVIDFGIAKAMTAARSSAAPTNASGPVTQVGFVVGTPGYMAPEQAMGQGEVDPRADIYSFGCVAYEMFSGNPPFTKATIQETLLAHMMEAPKSGTLRRAEIPRPIADLVMSCLAKDAANRPQTASELLRIIQSDSSIRTPTPAAGIERAPAIAVLPFENMSGEKDNEYFTDGITEEIINALTQIEGLRVVGRTSSFVFKDAKRDLRAIGQQLEVTTVLEGSVRKSGNRLRITAQLIKVADGYHLWSERYDREMNDVFAVQDEIAKAIAAKLRLSLGHRAGLIKPRTLDVEAYELFLKGRALLYRNGHYIYGGIDCFKQAIERDDDFAMAHAALAEALLIAAYNALRGVALDPESFWGQWALQRCYQAAGMHEESIQQAALTLAMSGRHPWPLSELAVTYASIGNTEAADAIYCELAARNRIEMIQPTPFALAATCAGKYEEAIALGHQAVEQRDGHIRWAALDDRWEGWAPLQKQPGWDKLKGRIDNW